MAPLVAAKLIASLGKPAANGPKYFAAVEIIEHANDSEWLTQATKALARYWQRKNRRNVLTGVRASLQAL